MKTWILRAGAAAGVAALAAGVFLINDDDGPREVRLAVSTSAPVTDGSAYVKEAIENLRGAERFRFTQRVTGASAAADPGSGLVAGEVDLAKAKNELPKLKTAVRLHKAGSGAVVNAEQISIGDQVHVKGPGRPDYRPSPKKPTKGKGKPQGGGVDEVDVIDPVMLLLEPVASLPPGSFGAPSDPTAGVRQVRVTLPSSDALIVSVRDADRMIVGMSLTREGKTAAFDLSDFGASDITIEAPAP